MLDDLVAVVVSEEVVLEPAPLADFLQEVRQGVRRGVFPEQGVLNAGGSAVGDDVVHRPACFLQIGLGFPVLLLAGQLLLPPGAVVYPEQRALGVQSLELLLEQGVVRLQNAVPDIVAAGSAHGEDALPAQLKHLAPFQHKHRWADGPHRSAAPLLQRVGTQGIIVFMIAGDECRGKGPPFQEV